MTEPPPTAMPLTASILAIGDEIVSGITVDSNSAFLADALRSIGIESVGGFSVADDETALARALERALIDADVVLTTGGLGPTADDLTTAVVARVAGRDLRTDEESLRRIEERFRSRNIPMPPNNAKQALIPVGATIVPNPTGTAPGFICPVDLPDRTRHIICLPGVPGEMRRMAVETVLPWLRERAGEQRFGSRVFSTFGLSESRLDELLAGAIDPGEARLSFRAAFPRMQTRVVVSGSDEREIGERLDRLEARVRERLGSAVYAIGDEGMEETVVRLLTEQGRTVAVAESCTGGLIGSRITDVAGSSRVFLLGVIAYANEAKVRQLGVPEATLAEHGAVSVATAEAMARGVREAAGADLGLATTGIAGPGGGTPEKPVGTVCVALVWEGGAWSKRYDLGTRERDWVKQMTAQIALDRMRRWALGEVEGPD
jgi:nicotinamide-nucleotide amidase